MPRRLLLFCVVSAAVLVSALTVQYYREQIEWVREEQGRALTTIADVKAEAIIAWRRERLADAAGIPATGPFARYAQTYIAGRTPSPEAEREIREYFELLRMNHDYSGIGLFDSSGRLRIGSGSLAAGPDDGEAAIALRAIREKKAVFDDFRSGPSGAYVGLAGPVLNQTRHAVAAIVFRVDPNRILYSQLQVWPVPSASGETLLVRKEGDSILYLNELRHAKRTALTLRLGLNLGELPAARAARGYEGFLEGIDYRGVAVLAATRHVPDSPWYLVAKVDRGEVFGHVLVRTKYFGASLLLTVILAGCGLFLFWSRRESNHYQQLYSLEAERSALASRYANLQRQANDAILLVDDSGRIIEGNERAVAMYGYSHEQLLGLTVRDLRDPSALGDLQGHWRAAESEIGTVFETVHRRSDGSILPVEVSSRSVRVGDSRFRLSIVRDISERKRVEQALRNSQVDLNRAQAVAHVGSWRLDVGHNRLEWSDETYRIFGVPTGTPLTYDGFLSFVYPADRESVSAAWERALSGAPYDIEHRITVNGTIRWVREQAELEFDADGNVTGGFGTVQDITERTEAKRALEESEERFRQLVENIDSVFWITELHSDRLLYISPAVTRLWGISSETTAGASRWEDAVHPDDRSGVADFVRKSRHEACEVECRVVLPSGDVRWARARAFPILHESADASRVAGVAEDITERKHSEQALQRMNESLQEFAFAASHDLQEPIRMVKCFTELLARRYRGRFDGEGERLLSTIVEGSRRMSELMQGLQAYTRVSQQERLSARVDMEEALGLALANLGRVLEENHASITYDQLPEVSWDKTPAVQLFQNLIGNALKYRKLHEPVSVHIACDRRDGMWCFSVRDNGIGMDPALAHRVFGLFKRLHGREYPGMGIGLALCRKIVERQGGRIWVDSELGIGSTFYFTVPAHAPVTTAQEQVISAPASS